MANTGNTTSFNAISDWSSTTQYQTNEIVKYFGNYYFAIKPSKGVSPISGLNIYWSDSSTFIWKPTYNSSIQNKFNTIQSSFNQIAGAVSIEKTDINNAFLVINCLFDVRSNNETKAILFFLELQRGCQSFNFYLDSPYNETISCICQKWSHSYKFYNNNEINAIFEEVG